MMASNPAFEDIEDLVSALLDGAAPVTSSTILVLPLGATEQHGKHLPLETDTLIAQGICNRLAAQIGSGLDVRFLNAEPIGYSSEHMDHAGSRTLSYGEAIDRWIAFGECAAKSGIRRFVLLNAHGGNSPLMTIVAQELRVRCSQFAVATSWTRFIKHSEIVSTNEAAFGIHGGDIETSVMLALHSDQVDMAEARDFPNLQEMLALNFKHLRAYGPHAFGWKAADLNQFGVTGNAGNATAQKGEALIEAAVSGLNELLEDISIFDLALLKDA
ncbi:MAG: creatininase family protein [Rhizobiaceae bacterium]|nr:creatininase family protein [Rhizobiaceae bacterium]